MATHWIGLGDTLTPLYAQLQAKDSTGTLDNVDLTSKTVNFKMVDQSGTTVVAETAATVVAASTGIVSYDFQADDVDTAGTFWGWFLVYSGGEHDTYPSAGREMRIVITDRV